MKVSVKGWVLGAGAVAALLMVDPVLAQLRTGTGGRLSTTGQPKVAATSEKEAKIEIKRFPPPNKTSMVRTPEFNASVMGGQPKLSKRPREWALFEVKYATSAKWTDELAFTYHVMAQGKDDEGKATFAYYTMTIRYINIPKGDHMSCAALPPSMVERYGEPVALALEIVGKDGTVLASQSESIVNFNSKEWWKDPNVLDKPIVTRRTGLMDRSKTPFALINADDYEVVQ
jgi:hypothetical protein